MRVKRTIFSLASAAIVAAQSSNTSSQSLEEVLSSNEDLSTFREQLMNNTELMDSLNSGNVTIFAPTNEAFSEFLNSSSTEEETQFFGGDEEDLIRATLRYHVLNGTYTADDVTDQPTYIPTFLTLSNSDTDGTYTWVSGGQVLGLTKEGEDVLVTSGSLNKTNVTEADIRFSNGIIHIVDHVLEIPPNINDFAVTAGLTQFAGYLENTPVEGSDDESLAALLGGSVVNITYFAPTDRAFEAIAYPLTYLSDGDVAAILNYHIHQGIIAYSPYFSNTSISTLDHTNLNLTVYPDGAVFADSARVISTDHLVENGVLHVLDAVLNPNGTSVPEPTAAQAEPAFESAMSSQLPAPNGIETSTSLQISTTDNVNEGFTTAPTGALGPATPTEGTSITQAGAPKATGAIGAAALFGGAAFLAAI